MSRDRATSLDRCQFPSRSARRIETLCSPERSRIACRKVRVHPGEPQAAARLARRSLFFVELGALKGCPGILSLDYLGKERTNPGGHTPVAGPPSPLPEFDCSPLVNRIVLRAKTEQG